MATRERTSPPTHDRATSKPSRGLYDSAHEPGWTGGTDEGAERERSLRFVEDAGVRGVNPGIDAVTEEELDTDDLGASRHPGVTPVPVPAIESDEDADSPNDPALIAAHPTAVRE